MLLRPVMRFMLGIDSACASVITGPHGFARCSSGSAATTIASAPRTSGSTCFSVGRSGGPAMRCACASTRMPNPATALVG